MGRISKMPVELPAMEIGAMVGDWWEEINESTQWQDGIFYALCGAYALVSAVALIQLIRIELRVPEYGWTTQKVFHLMNFIVNGVRAIVFGFHKQVFTMNPQALVLVLLDLPGLLFFSTYTLLVLFWAEIYHQASARSLPTDKLRVVYISVNVAMYFVQVYMHMLCIDVAVPIAVNSLHLGVPLGRRQQHCGINWKDIYCRLDQSQPYASLASLYDVLCFLFNSISNMQIFLSAFDADASLDVLDHPVLNLIYYMLVEILPSALVLFILRKLPPKRISAQYHPIR
ncbi:hypothetical protein POTOM_016656 [Populus tomentosa]|uniref:THH1/TOM1/TOM3 domain-containing protein n=1 Tax=Populus tomentosa TaxID=118781 RepID=A0A8X7ZXH4_POPTO|nr:hypothetical protein POTOM_016656 [Populus tomentosa]